MVDEHRRPLPEQVEAPQAVDRGDGVEALPLELVADGADQGFQSGKEVWVTEMQATPWFGTTGFTVEDLIASALAYRGHGVSGRGTRAGPRP